MYIKKDIQILYEELEDKLELYLQSYDKKLLNKAFKFAYKKHWEQQSLWGRSRVAHLLWTAIRLAELYADFNSVVAGLLHDVLRDTEVKYSLLEKRFWKDIAKMVKGITNILSFKYEEGMTTRDLEFLKKFFKLWWKDVRVLLVLISDMVDFIKTIETFDDDIKIKKAREVLDIYIPMIKIFGIWKYIWNIEDLCYRYLDPKEFSRINSILESKKDFLSNKIDSYKDLLSKALFDKWVENQVEGRIKTVYSIAKKIKKKHIPFSWIYDLIAFRVIVESKRECYVTMSILHSLFKSKDNRIKDYISAPKPNGYQSLHTTVSDSAGDVFEIQIQTKQMYTYNMYWLASHNSYKWFSSDHTTFPKWMRNLLKQQKKLLFWKDIIEEINPESLRNTIICTTPKAEEIELPKKSTILDFAFKIHSELWKKIIGAWVNNEYIDDLMYMLAEWDQVTLSLWKEESNYPVRYLSYLKTDAARKALKTIFRNKSKYKRTLLGKHLLNERMELMWYKPFSHMPSIIRKEVEEGYKLEDSEHLYSEIGAGDINVDNVINTIYNLKNDNAKYKSIVSLKILFKKKDNKNIHALFDLFHDLDVNIISAHYKWNYIYTDINVKDLTVLHELLAEISRLPNIFDVKRRFTKRTLIFFVVLSLVSALIISSPFILFFIEKYFGLSDVVYKIMFYISITFFVFLLYFFKHIAKATLPWLIKQKVFWWWMFLLNTFILATAIWQLIYVFDTGNGVFFFSLAILLYGLTLFEYIDWKIEDKNNN